MLKAHKLEEMEEIVIDVLLEYFLIKIAILDKIYGI